MAKYTATLLLGTILLLFNSCGTKKRDFCDCMNLMDAFSDSYMLSQDEQERKKKECEWIERELSQVEISTKLLECWGSDSSTTNNSENETNQEVDVIEEQNTDTQNIYEENINFDVQCAWCMETITEGSGVNSGWINNSYLEISGSKFCNSDCFEKYARRKGIVND
ncbi:MAG: hypothetical protein ACK45U_02325 [bacterium]